MIYFKPENISENVTKFIAIEDEKSCGYCILKTDGNIADVYCLEFEKDKPYMVEGLLRSAYNFASLRNIYIGKCTCKNIDSFLDNMNFEKNEEGYINDIPTILTGSCCK
ncbi:MAG: hypothetical protein IJB74_01450 [Clostridia bacterium]|nr:hypothetical protein [Clostridia bacterium]